MATNSHEKLFWLGCGLAIVFATKVISWQLGEAARLSRVVVDKAREADQEGSSGTSKDEKQAIEDDVSLETLAVLIDHPNYDIRHAARRIVLNRFANNAECCMRLSRDYFKPEKQSDAAAVLMELIRVADDDSLVRSPNSGNPEGSHTTIDGILRAAAQERSSRADSRGPVVTLEEVGGDNGEVISLRLSGNTFVRTVSQEREESPEELALRRWRRREAMVVEVDADEGAAELILPS